LLEGEMAQMRAEAQKTQQTLATLQGRLRQAEQGRYRNVLVYILVATTLLGILAAAVLWWLRPRQRQRARWFEAQANQQARVAARGGPSTSAGLASQPAPLSRPAVLSPPVLKPATRPASLRPASTTVSPSYSGMSSGSGSLMPTTQHSSIGGLEVTTVLGPEVSPSSFEAFGGGGAARPRATGELSMEELIDLEQQAEFFVVLGQDEAAMSLLEGYIDGTGKSPLPYLQLLEIHQRRDDRDAYDKVRTSFNERFDAHAPDWNVSLHRGRSLEDYPQTVALLQSLWTTPLSAMQELDRLLFRREEADVTFDFPAYRELLLLYSVARENSENVETDFGSIDLYLPLDDGPAESAPSQFEELEATRPQRGPVEVDLDVSQWPEDAAMSDLLGRDRPSGRRGAG
jgi:pilus assembly protein FimV